MLNQPFAFQNEIEYELHGDFPWQIIVILKFKWHLKEPSFSFLDEFDHSKMHSIKSDFKPRYEEAGAMAAKSTWPKRCGSMMSAA